MNWQKRKKVNVYQTKMITLTHILIYIGSVKQVIIGGPDIITYETQVVGVFNAKG